MAILTPKQISKLTVADRLFLEQQATQIIKPIARQMRVAALKAVAENTSPTPAIEAGFGALAEASVPAAVRSHFHAMARERMLAGVGDIIQLPKTSHQRAIDFYRKRMEISDADLAKLTDRYGAHALRVTNKAGTFASEKIERALLAIQEEGLHVSSAVRQTALRQAMIDSGIDLGTRRGAATLETIVRTQTALAQAAGQGNARKDPALDEILWGYEYVTVGDGRVRPKHAALHGTTAPKDHPIWNTITPPNGFNCRCILVAIYVNELDRQEIDLPPDQLQVEVDGMTVTIIPGPDKDFAFNPADLFEDVNIASSAPGPLFATPPVKPEPLRPTLKPDTDLIKKSLQPAPGVPIVKPDLVALKKAAAPLEKKLKDELQKTKVPPAPKPKSKAQPKAVSVPGGKYVKGQPAPAPTNTRSRSADGGLKQGTQIGNDWGKNLSTEEREVLRDWSLRRFDDLQDYQKGILSNTRALAQATDNALLEQALARSEGFDGNVFRGMRMKKKDATKFIDGIIKDGGLELQQLSSASKSIKVAKEFTEGSGTKILLRIRNKTGVDIQAISTIKKEKEVILRRGARYEYVKTRTVRKQVFLREAEETIEITLKEI